MAANGEIEKDVVQTSSEGNEGWRTLKRVLRNRGLVMGATRYMCRAIIVSNSLYELKHLIETCCEEKSECAGSEVHQKWYGSSDTHGNIEE